MLTFFKDNPCSLFTHSCFATNGTSDGLFESVAKSYNVKCERMTQSADNIVRELKKGKVIVAHMGPGHFTGGGHYIVLKGLTSEGKVVVADPNGGKQGEDKTEVLLGDVNCDGKIDVTDISVLAIALVDKKELPEASKINADVDKDGTAGLTDLATIRQFISKLIDKF